MNGLSTICNGAFGDQINGLTPEGAECRISATHDMFGGIYTQAFDKVATAPAPDAGSLGISTP